MIFGKGLQILQKVDKFPEHDEIPNGELRLDQLQTTDFLGEPARKRVK